MAESVVIRFDYGKVQKSERHPDGSLRVWATVSHRGALSYGNPDGSRRIEYLDDADLFDADSLNTLAGIPYVSPHPQVLTPSVSEVKGLVMSQHIADHGRGALMTDIVVRDPQAIADIESGAITGLSLGYKCKLEQRQDGKLYQTNRRYYHLAGVKVPRAPGARFHLDSQDPDWDLRLPVNAILFREQFDAADETEKEGLCQVATQFNWDCNDDCNCKDKKTKRKGRKKMQFNLDGNQYEMDDSVGVVLSGILTKLDALAARFDMMNPKDEEEEEDVERVSKKDKAYKDRLDSLEGERDALAAALDSVRSDKEDAEEEDEEDDEEDDEEMDAADWVANKVALISQVSPLVGLHAKKLATMSNSDIQRLAIRTVDRRFDAEDLATRSPEEISGMFSALINSASHASVMRATLGGVVRQDAMPVIPGSVSVQAHAKLANAYSDFLKS